MVKKSSNLLLLLHVLIGHSFDQEKGLLLVFYFFFLIYYKFFFFFLFSFFLFLLSTFFSNLVSTLSIPNVSVHASNCDLGVKSSNQTVFRRVVDGFEVRLNTFY